MSDCAVCGKPVAQEDKTCYDGMDIHQGNCERLLMEDDQKQMAEERRAERRNEEALHGYGFIASA